jgi:hypothetical protein
LRLHCFFADLSGSARHLFCTCSQVATVATCPGTCCEVVYKQHPFCESFPHSFPTGRFWGCPQFWTTRTICLYL